MRFSFFRQKQAGNEYHFCVTFVRLDLVAAVLPCRLIRKLISLYATSMNIELQQRSIEFAGLFRSQEQIR